MAGMRRPVAVIIGMMGAGKTRVGKEVARMMNLPFADADNGSNIMRECESPRFRKVRRAGIS